MAQDDAPARMINGKTPVKIHEQVYPRLARYAVPLLPPVGRIIGREQEKLQVLSSLNRPRLSNVLLTAPAGSGKALALTEKIPTPTGWTTMGELSVGDEVLGQDGKPTRVSFLSEVNPEPEMYDLTFSDGSVITACADHQWKVSSSVQREASYPSRTARAAEVNGAAQARSAALRDLVQAYAGQWLTAQETLEAALAAEVPGWTWKSHDSMGTYLKKQGVERRKGHRERIRHRTSNGPEVMRAAVVEFEAASAFTLLSEQKKGGVRKARAAESVMTTKQMLEAGVRISACGRVNFAVRVAAPLELPEAELPMDPYVLGVWLGDGSRGFRRQAGICSMDDHVIDRVQAQGFALRRVEDIKGKASVYFFDELGTALTQAGIDPVAEKFIPPAYLRASFEQRLELLRGLLDTDGFIDDKGAIELTFSTARLAADAEELIRTLGIKVTRKVSEAGYRDADGELIRCQDRHRMHFTTTLPVFTLPRRAEKLPEQVRSTQGLLYIESIEPAPSVPARCIQVDNDDHMYLAGRGMVPTHNTVLVQETMISDPDRIYLEVDPSRMNSDVAMADQMAGLIKGLFDDAEAFARDEGRELVLFIDEFHQIVQMSPAAVEALKPVLAASGSRGLKVIAATTYEEWIEYIRPNKPLDERLQRVNLTPAGRQMTIDILRSFVEEEGLSHQLPDDGLLAEIHDVTNRYVPSSVQPRKSIGVMDGMIGWHRQTGEPLTWQLMAKVLRLSTGVNLGFNADGTSIKRQLDEKVFAQDMATRIISDQLQVVVADLHNKNRPKGRFLFAGSTGVGKGTLINEPIPVYSEDGSVSWKQAGELVPGDQVFARDGSPEEVLGVFPQGEQDVYRVTLADGRSLVTDGAHLWGLYPRLSDRGQGLTVMSTETLALRLENSRRGAGKKLRYSIPMNQPVQWPERPLPVPPYALGALIADGCLTKTSKMLTISSDDEPVVARVAQEIGALGYDEVGKVRRKGGKVVRVNYNWLFRTEGVAKRGFPRIQKDDVLGGIEGVNNTYSHERRIPQEYMTASVEQRWDLIKGLFDSDGHIGSADDGRYNVSYSTSSEGLAEDVRKLLWSVGVASTVMVTDRRKSEGPNRRLEYTIHVKTKNSEKHRFFWLPRKLEIAHKAATVVRTKTFDTEYVDIVSVEKLPDREQTVCIYVDHPEHLYQAGEHFIVTHNTEVTKQLVDVLFGDDLNRLIRFDMSEFALDSSLDLFRSELTNKVVSMGDSVILLDEIEKASRVVLRLLLQVLDDGRLSDDHGRQVSFLDCYIILTTNAGSEVFETIGSYAADDTGSGEGMEDFMKTIENSIRRANGFPPELLGRLDAIVPFQPLSDATKRRILQRGLNNLQREVKTKHDVRLGISERVLEYLAIDSGEDAASSGGARESMRALHGRVTVEVAKYLNARPNEKVLFLDIQGKMRAEDLALRKSKARPIVMSEAEARSVLARH